MGRGRSAGRWFVALGLAALVGCGAGEVRKTYDNRRALESRVERPASGSPADRTYRNPGFRETRFGGVRVEEPRLRGELPGDPAYEAFLAGLRETLWVGTAQALRDAGRYGPVERGPAAGDLVCRIEALPHVAALGQPVRPDPVFGDTRPKLIAVFTVARVQTGEVVLKYTAWAVSQWDYGPWAMEDLQTAALRLAGEFQEVLGQE